MARNLKSEDAVRYHKIEESKVNRLWVGKGEHLGLSKSLLPDKNRDYLLSLQPRLPKGINH